MFISEDGLTHGHESNLSLPGLKFQEKCRDGERCVPYHQCLDDFGAGIFNVRMDKVDDLYLPCETLQVCCEPSKIRETTQKFKTADSCGFRNFDGLGFYAIGNDNESQFGEFPWMMAVLKKVKIGDHQVLVYTSGGSLIGESVILTSAHNIDGLKAEELIIRGGEWNTRSVDEVLEHQERKVFEIAVHPNFTRKNLQNDVALIFLTEPFQISPHINTICLPESSYKLDNKRCLVTGWGKNNFGKTENYQVFMKKIEVPIVLHNECQKRLRKTRLGADFILHEGFLCAGGEIGIDACTGDGGSPLVCPIDDSGEYYFQAGLVVGGIGCGGNVPAFYANVLKYNSWIQEQIDSRRVENPDGDVENFDGNHL